MGPAPSRRPVALYLPLPDLDAAPGRALLEEAGFEVRRWEDGGRPGPGTVALLAGYDRVDAALMDAAPDLRIVATHSAGTDMVDLEAARARGLWVANLPASATEEVAVHALALALALLRRLPEHAALVRAGTWDSGAVPAPRRPSTLTCGVLGVGRIGRRFADLARPVFGRLVAADPLVPAASWPAGIERLDVDGLFAASDVLSLHVPATPGTRAVVDRRRLALLPPGAVVVNTSRGSLVDEEALLAALAGGRLAGAGLDVLAQEPPPPGSPLVGHPRVLLTPHAAFLSSESLQDYARDPARNVVAWHRHGTPLTPVAGPGL